MQRRLRKTKWEMAAISTSALFLASCATAAGLTAQPKGQKTSYTYTEPIMRQAVYSAPLEYPMAEASSTADEECPSSDWSAEDEDILLHIAMAEAEGETTEGKALVMLVVLNRMKSDEFPDTIKGVVFQTVEGEYQFSTVIPGKRYWTETPDEDCREALELIKAGWDESDGALYFESCSGDSWQSEHCEYLFTYGGHKFYK